MPDPRELFQRYCEWRIADADLGFALDLSRVRCTDADLAPLMHKMTEAQVKREASLPEFGLRWVETIDVLPRQHIVVFERRAD